MYELYFTCATIVFVAMWQCFFVVDTTTMHIVQEWEWNKYFGDYVWIESMDELGWQSLWTHREGWVWFNIYDQDHTCSC